MILSYGNGKGTKTVLKVFKLFVFFGYIAKICILQALVSILAIGLEKKSKHFFSNFQKKSKFSFFLLFTAMCYDHGEDIKSYFMTSRKPKKQKKSQNNAYKILELKVKNDSKLHFFDFFFQSQ